jgi:hypothetical protein
LLSHRYKQVALSQNVAARNITHEILLLLTSNAVSTGLIKDPRSQKYIISFNTEELTFTRVALFDIAEL